MEKGAADDAAQPDDPVPPSPPSRPQSSSSSSSSPPRPRGRALQRAGDGAAARAHRSSRRGASSLPLSSRGAPYRARRGDRKAGRGRAGSGASRGSRASDPAAPASSPASRRLASGAWSARPLRVASAARREGRGRGRLSRRAKRLRMLTQPRLVTTATGRSDSLLLLLKEGRCLASSSSCCCCPPSRSPLWQGEDLVKARLGGPHSDGRIGGLSLR